MGFYFHREIFCKEVASNSDEGENENLCGNDIMFPLRLSEDNKYFSLGR